MSDAVVKKVTPYPIQATFEIEGNKVQGRIKKLVEHGFLIEIDDNIILLNKKGQIVFEIPVMGVFVNTPVKVIKTYDRFDGIGKMDNAGEAVVAKDGPVANPDAKTDGKKIYRIVEMHFLLLPEDKKEAITRFLKKIKQR